MDEQERPHELEDHSTFINFVSGLFELMAQKKIKGCVVGYLDKENGMCTARYANPQTSDMELLGLATFLKGEVLNSCYENGDAE